MKNILAIIPFLLSATAVAQPTSVTEDTLRNSNPLPSTRFWTQFGQNPSNNSISNATLADLNTPLWVSDGDAQTHINFLPQSGIVATHHAVFALGYADKQPDDLIAAFNPTTGELLWTAPIPIAFFDSWSTPAIDQRNKAVITASGSTITAFDTATGTHRWQTALDRPIVNASPTITHDLVGANRLFITDYAFAGAQAGQLYCINIDPFRPSNPYQPGEIVWKTSLDGPTSGNTPAYSNGIVYASTAGSATNAGLIHAFDANSSIAPAPLWTTTNPEPSGFFSGVSIADDHIYASSYNFAAGQYISNTLKLDKDSGEIIWSTPSNRTDVSPIITSDDRVILSSGTQAGALTFFGSIPSIQLFAPDGTMLWDSAYETLDDINTNGTYDHGESYLSVGGWTHQPILVEHDNATLLYAGTLADPDLVGFFVPCTDLRVIDLDLLPNDPGFIIDQFAGAGSTPAISNGILYTVGENGLHAFAQSTPATIIDAFNDHTLSPLQAKRRLQLSK